MAVLIASDLSKDIAGSPLLRGVSFKLERRDRLTVAGRNGAGKTTLLRMLAGETSVDGGDLSFQKGCKVALHDQRPPTTRFAGGAHRDLSLRDYILGGCAELVQLEADLTRLAQEMADGIQGAFDAYSRAQARLEHAGGWNWRERATAMVRGLGFDHDADLDRSLKTFSGGELTRASLARALAGDPDLLLLDEPTNHLDIESLEWLEKTLVSLDTAVVLVAHDRWFLEAVGTAVLELEGALRPKGVVRSRFFPGTWTQWRKEQAAREIALGRAIDKQQAEIQRLERFVERFRAKATKAKQAQSRVKRLDKIERIERGAGGSGSREALKFDFKAPERSGRVVFEMTGARIEVGSPPKVLLDGAEIWLERGEHVTLVGANGTGKTTLIDTLAGLRPPAAGKLSTGHNVKLGHLSQHADELGQGGDGFRARTVTEAAVVHTGLTPNKARALLGRFLFSGAEAEKPLEGLSGGERRRLSLAILVASGANVLILDEPTNHLDLESREALEDALLAYEGTLLLVSHDRALLEAVGTRTVAVQDGTLRSYEGGWQEYLRVREERRLAERAPRRPAGPKPARKPDARPAKKADARPAKKADARPAKKADAEPAKKPAAEPAKKPKAATAPGCAAERLAAATIAEVERGGNGNGAKQGLSKNARRRIRDLEREIEQAEEALKALEAELALPEAWATPDRSAASAERHANAKRAVEEAFARWEAAAS